MAPSPAVRRLAVISQTVAPAGGSFFEQQACAAAAPSIAEYRPKAVLFTGGAGFIGSNTLIYMVQNYPDVKFVCLDNLSEGSNPANLAPVQNSPNLVSVVGSIVSEALVRSLMEQHNVDTVMHFAAQTHVDRSFVRPISFAETNVIGTAVLLKVAREMGVRRFLHVSTDEVYGENVNNIVFDEEAHLMPGNPYSASKAAAECMVRGWISSFGKDLPIVVVRPNNIYGPRQYPEKLIPKFILRLGRGQTLPLHGGGHSRRSFLFVEDAAKAFDIVLRKGMPGEAYNIGAAQDSTKSVIEVANAILPYFGIDPAKSKNHLDIVEDRFKNDASYDVDSTRIRALGWTPVVGFDEGLKRTVEWYKQNPSHWTGIEQALLPHNSGTAESIKS